MFKPKKVLVPTDFSKAADHALAQGAEIAQQFGAELTLLHVTTKDADTMPLYFLDDDKIEEIHKNIDNNIKSELEKLAEKHLEGKGITFKTLVKHGQPYADIIAYVNENDYDLIVISSKGKSALEGFFFGSTTEKVVRKAPCSVLVTRAGVS